MLSLHICNNICRSYELKMAEQWVVSMIALIGNLTGLMHVQKPHCGQNPGEAPVMRFPDGHMTFDLLHTLLNQCDRMVGALVNLPAADNGRLADLVRTLNNPPFYIHVPEVKLLKFDKKAAADALGKVRAHRYQNICECPYQSAVDGAVDIWISSVDGAAALASM